MNDERRERYAAAMAEAHDAGPEWSFEWYPEADAVMAVVDGEAADLRRELAQQIRAKDALVEENERLTDQREYFSRLAFEYKRTIKRVRVALGEDA